MELLMKNIICLLPILFLQVFHTKKELAVMYHPKYMIKLSLMG